MALLFHTLYIWSCCTCFPPCLSSNERETRVSMWNQEIEPVTHQGLYLTFYFPLECVECSAQITTGQWERIRQLLRNQSAIRLILYVFLFVKPWKENSSILYYSTSLGKINEERTLKVCFIKICFYIWTNKKCLACNVNPLRKCWTQWTEKWWGGVWC